MAWLYLNELGKPEFLPCVSLGLEALPWQFDQFDGGEALPPIEVIWSNLCVLMVENANWESSLLLGLTEKEDHVKYDMT